MNAFRRWRLAVAISPFLVLACGKVPPSPEVSRPVLTQVVGVPAGAALTRYAGEVRSRYETPLAFRISGKIVARLVDAGEQVAAGQALARLDPSDTAIAVAAAQAQLDLAGAELRRYRELRAQNFVSQAALDVKETAYRNAQAQADLARNQSAYTVLRADRAGVVELIAAEIGQVVSAGQTVMRVARTDTPEVAIFIPEAQVAQARRCRQAEITLWADAQAEYRGMLREVSASADPLTRTYAARVSVAKPDERLLLGMSAQVRLLCPNGTEASEARLQVPPGAIFQHDGAPAVWVVGADQRLSLRSVEVAAYAEDGVVLSAGVARGEHIVVAGVHKLNAGEKIRAVDSATAVQP